jgi:hypothetical protein
MKTMQLSKDLQGIAADLSKQIERSAGEPVAFTLLVYTEGRASYISNATREESVREIKHLIDLWGHGMPDIPAHEYVA